MNLTIEDGNEAKNFEEIAANILNECAIKTHDAKYRITEIEFYWTSGKHTDNSTYKRTHVDH